MLMHPGDKVHVVTRRLFENDVRRHFVGEIQAVAESAIRVKGFIFVFDKIKNEFHRHPEERIRIISLTDSDNIINIIPSEVNIEDVSYQISPENDLVVTDGKNFTLDMREFS